MESEGNGGVGHIVSRKAAEKKRLLIRLCREQKSKCAYCKIPMTWQHRQYPADRDATIDHKVPRAKARGLQRNKVAACHGCNKHKQAKSVEEYMATRYFAERVRRVQRQFPDDKGSRSGSKHIDRLDGGEQQAAVAGVDQRSVQGSEAG